ncbi:hypothetical protein EUGRSUZ_B03279 [Eucalyptus grandis]|uniref:Uncharacterized protein n=2 Tax=Eucalyptus grandis TaxID=71139 RepID=A0ACC3LWY0_EUCGR|nr:hypothetical protein EUGRSUZ_B03279 [Eucalyptus grandis]
MNRGDNIRILASDFTFSVDAIRLYRHHAKRHLDVLSASAKKQKQGSNPPQESDHMNNLQVLKWLISF